MASIDDEERQRQQDHFDSSSFEGMAAFIDGFLTVVTFTAFDSIVDDDKRRLRAEFKPGARRWGMATGVALLVVLAILIGRRIAKYRKARTS